MQKNLPPIHPRSKAFLYFIVAMVALAIVTPALADYLGPNRTVVTQAAGGCKVNLLECQYVSSKNVWRYRIVDSWVCANESKPWRDYPSTGSGCNSLNAGDVYWERQDVLQEVINTYPPATIDSSLQNCTLNNGWCITPPQLSLSGSEPVPGYSINSVEGTLNGQTFTCSGSTCTIPLSEGNNNFNYWAISSWGDSSTMGTLSAKVDSQLPDISGALSGPTGLNGWYLGTVSFNSSATDATSGLASFTCTLDGTPLSSCSSTAISDEGPHTLVLIARDQAGNTRTETQNASIDARNPILTAGIDGTVGSNSWYTAATLIAAASDPLPGSGLSVFEYNIDGGGWSDFPVSGELSLPDGRHSLNVHAMDNAGHITSSTKSYWLDSIAPAITLDPAGTSGTNNWYITSLNLAASANDSTSGVDKFEYFLDNATWVAYTIPLTIRDGSHNVSFWAQDQAGLVTQVDRVYNVDTRPPQIAGSIAGISGMNGWYISDVKLSASAADPSPGSGLDSFTYILNDTTETPYTNPVLLSNGQHTIKLNGKDKAGLTYSTEQVIKVDTIHPSLDIDTVLPTWVKNGVTLSGAVSDHGSGLSKVEISTDDGRTWQAMTGLPAWSYDWDTRNSINGVHNVHVRAIDAAGLTSEERIQTGVDNHGPNIKLPDSWYQWDTVTLDVWDNHSGLYEVQVEISDPEGRWKKRVIELDPKQFPLNFKWDRRFGDNTTAPLGTYNVKVIALDNIGNITRETASIKILLGILPAGPTATIQPYSRSASTPTPLHTATPQLSITHTQTPAVSVFGDIEPTSQSTPVPAIVAAPRETPVQTTVRDWLESIFIPNSDSKDSITEFASLGTQSADSRSAGSSSNVLWGAATAAMVGAVTAYALEDRRKLQADIVRESMTQEQRDARAEQAANKAQEKEERKRKKARQMAVIEVQRAQEAALEAARQEQAQPRTSYQDRMDSKMAGKDLEEDQKWTASLIAIQRKAEEKKKADELKEGLAAYYAAMRQGEKEAPKPEPNWWEKTKSYVGENIIQPLNTNYYQPYIKPVVEIRDQALESVGSWLGKNIYEPYLKPGLEKAWQSTKDTYTRLNENVLQPLSAEVGEALASGIAWTNEKIFQPYIKPWAEKRLEVASKRLEWLNEKIYQPYLKPRLQQIHESFVQPYVAPLIEKTGKEIAEFASLVNKNIYQPIFEPVIKDINQYIYQPAAEKVNNWWGQYGEWVHGALDTAGFIPGLGDIGDGLNGLLYLAEGHYIEASVSALAMIPLVGDLAKAGKWGLKVGIEVAEEVVEKVVKEATEEVAEQVVKEIVEETTEKILKETGEELVEQTSQVVVKEALEEAGENIATKTIKESLENSIERGIKEELVEDTFKEATEVVVTKTIKNTTSEIVEKSANEVVKKVSKRTAQVTDALISRYGDRATQLLEIVDPLSATKLLKNVGDDVIVSAIKQGDEVVEALSHWSAKELKEHGSELLIRANRDAKALSFVKKLLASGPIDVKNLTLRQQRLIKLIAGYSTQNLSSLQIVLGKWVDINGGFVKRAVDTGALHYNPHPDIWKLFAAGVKNPGEVAWLVNKEVVQNGIGKGFPFEYTLNGIKSDSIIGEKSAILAIFNGTPTDKEIQTLLKSEYIPVRIQELRELKAAGYQNTFDQINNSYNFFLP